MVPHSRVPTAGVVAFVGLAVLAALPGACTKMPLVAPSGSVITLIATTNVLPVNGSTDIIALVIENGTETTTTTTPGATPAATTPSAGTAVHNGTVVDFSTTLGRVEPAEAKTTGGQVTVKLIADGRSGVATVTAYSGGATKTLTINVGAAAASRILVTASPQSLPFPGGTSTINAIVQDQQSNPISGVPVAFSTTKGSLAATTAVTDAFGNATTTLSTTADATVTASAGGGTTGTLSGTVTVTIQSNSTLFLTAPTGTITVSTPITFTVGVGTAVAATDVVVNFDDGDTPVHLGPISQNQTVSHMYGSVKSFNPSATGFFVDGTQKTVFAPVVVNDYQVQPSCAPNINFVGGAASTFSLTVTPAGVSISDVSWRFQGDDAENETLHGNPVTKVWQSRGTKRTTWTVVPTKGSSKSGTCQLEVN